MSLYQLVRKQIIPGSIEEVWEFISSPKNLKDITPAYLGFNIKSGNLTDKMYPGMIIIYKVKPIAGIPLTWVSEITQVVDKKLFVDEQRFGPYTFWHHQHLIEPVDKGVLMTDIVSYKLPLYFLGNLANWLFIKNQLEKIFSYRENAINKKISSIHR